MHAAQSARRIPRSKPLIAAFAALACATFATTADAEITATQITSPTNEAMIDTANILGGETLAITGRATTSGTEGNDVRVFVLSSLDLTDGTSGFVGSAPLTVNPNGSFSVTVPRPTANARIIAVPTSADDTEVRQWLTTNPTSSFPSVLVLGGGFATAGLDPFPAGVRFAAKRGLRKGWGVLGSAGFGAEPEFFSDSLDIGGVTAGPTGRHGLTGGLTFYASSSIAPFYSSARTALMVDHQRTFLRDQLPLPATSVLPAPTVTRSVDPVTGGQTVTERQAVLAIREADTGSGLGEGADELSEDAFRSSGVELERTMVHGGDGRQITVTDVFRSTDGAPHRVDLLYSEGSGAPYIGDAPRCYCDDDSLPIDPPAFRVPWEANDWQPRGHGDPLSAPVEQRSTVFTRYPDFVKLITTLQDGGDLDDLLGEEPDIPSAYGAITFGTRLDGGVFVTSLGLWNFLVPDASTQFFARFVRDVPAGGTTTITTIYSLGETEAEVKALAADAEKQLTPETPEVPAAPITPLAPPPPPAAPQPTSPTARKAPRTLTASKPSQQRTKKGRYRFRFTGRLALPSGVSRSTCRAGGVVSVQIKVGRNTISNRRVKLNRNCRYSVRVTFRSAKRFGKRKRLRVITKWSGNKSLTAKTAKRFTVRVR